MTQEVLNEEAAPLRRKRSKPVPKEELEQKYPSLRVLTGAPGRAAESAWVATFNARPDAMQALLADYIKQVHARPGRIGQRPMPKEADVDFESLIYGELTEEPIHKALARLMKDLPPHLSSQRLFSAAVHMTRPQLRRLLNGTHHPDVDTIRTIATVVGKPPVYFVEYRRAMVIAAMVGLLEEQPGIATTLYQKYLTVRLGK